MQNIFIVHTPFHVFIAEKIVKDIPEISTSKNILLLEMSLNFKHYNPGLWSEVLFLENVGGSTMGRDRFLLSEKNIAIVRKYADEDVNTCLFMSDIAWPMNNRLFFDKQLRESVDYCLFSDGLGTYVAPRVTPILFARGIAKGFNGFLNRGVKYTNYLGNQFGLDRKEITCIYAPNVEQVDCDPLKRREIPFNSIKEGYFNKSKCLFLDTPSWLETSPDDWCLIRETALNYLKSLNVSEYYYKNHHLGRKEEEIYYENNGFNIITSNKCAEQIVAENNFGVVVSYLSSSLFNLKCMYQNNIQCISLFSKTISTANGFNDNTTDKIYECYNNVDVEIINII